MPPPVENLCGPSQLTQGSVSLLHPVSVGDGGGVKDEERWDFSIRLHVLCLSALWKARVGAFTPASLVSTVCNNLWPVS